MEKLQDLLDLKQTVAFLYMRKGQGSLTQGEIELSTSMDFRWFSPADAKKFVELGIRVGLLKETNENKLAPGFDLDSVEVPMGFKPSKEVLRIPDNIVQEYAKMVKMVQPESAPDETQDEEVDKENDKETDGEIEGRSEGKMEEKAVATTIEDAVTPDVLTPPGDRADVEQAEEGQAEAETTLDQTPDQTVDPELEEPTTPQKPVETDLDAFETKSLFLRTVDKIVEAEGFEKTQVISEINRRQDHLNVAIEVAGLLTARKYDIDISELLNECREELIKRAS